VPCRLSRIFRAADCRFSPIFRGSPADMGMSRPKEPIFTVDDHHLADIQGSVERLEVNSLLIFHAELTRDVA